MQLKVSIYMKKMQIQIINNYLTTLAVKIIVPEFYKYKICQW